MVVCLLGVIELLVIPEETNISSVTQLSQVWQIGRFVEALFHRPRPRFLPPPSPLEFEY